MSDAVALERLIAELCSPDLLVRIQSAEALGELGDKRAVEPLIAAIDDHEWRVCRAAIEALGKLGDERAVSPIERAFHREDLSRGSYDRAITFEETEVDALRRLGEPGFQALLRLLHDFIDYEFPGAKIAGALGEMADPRSLDTLLLALRSTVYEVAQAAESVCNLGSVAVEPLVKLLGGESSSACFHASQALKWMGPSVIPKLLEALESAADPIERANIIETLGKFEDDAVIPSLVAALFDAHTDVREVAALALGDRHDPRAVEQLLLIEQRIPGSNVAALTLAEIGQPAVAPLLSALSDRERPAYVRYNAACALGFIGDSQAYHSLFSVLQESSEDHRIRAAAATALGQLKSQAAVQPLLGAVSDASPAVRKAAIRALGEIESPDAFDALAAIVLDITESPDVRQTALLTLGFHFGDRTMDVIRKVFQQGDRMVSAVCNALPFERWSEDALLQYAQDKDPYIRRIAMNRITTVLHFNRDTRLVAFLANMLTLDDDAMRQQAAFILGRLGDVRAAGVLITALSNPSILARIEAARALAVIGDERAIPALEKALADGINTGARYQRLASHVEGEAHDAFQSAILSIRRRQSEPIHTKERDG